jgi:hypothetical protein
VAAAALLHRVRVLSTVEALEDFTLQPAPPYTYRKGTRTTAVLGQPCCTGNIYPTRSDAGGRQAGRQLIVAGLHDVTQALHVFPEGLAPI